MSRLIDADALLETMEKFFTKAEGEAIYAGRRNAAVTWNDAVYMIKTAPTIEPERGEWIVHFNDLFPAESTEECSICHAEQLINGNDDNFCPNCGARMEVER